MKAKKAGFFISMLIGMNCCFGQDSAYFAQRDMTVQESNSVVKHTVSIQVKNMPDSPRAISIAVLEPNSAGSLDYKLPSDTIVFYGSKRSTMPLSFTIDILPDSFPEPDKSVRLLLFYKSVSGKNILDTCLIRIKDYIKPGPATQINTLSTQLFYYPLSTSIHSLNAIVRSTNLSGKAEILIERLNPLPIQKSDSLLMQESIDKKTFQMLFFQCLRSMSISIGHADSADILKQAEILYESWQKKVLTLKEEQSKTELSKAIQKELDPIKIKLEEYAKFADTAKAQFTIRLGKIPIYKRNVYSKEKNTNIPKVNFSARYFNHYNYEVSMQNNEANKPDSVSIDSVSIRIENGYITSIVLYPSNDSFNHRLLQLNNVTIIRRFFDLRSVREAAQTIDYFFPLESYNKRYRSCKRSDGSLRRFKLNKTKYKPNDNLFSDYFVNLFDLLEYKPKTDFISDVLLHIRDQNLNFGMHTPKSISINDKDFNSFAQFNIYSDLIGLAEDKPNGILQVEGKFDIGLLTEPINNNRYYSKNRINFLHSMQLQVALTKIENKLRHLTLSSDSIFMYNREANAYDTLKRVFKHIRSIDLWQYRSLDVSMRLNLFKFESDFTSLLLQIGGGITRIPINDTTIGKDAAGKDLIKEDKSVISALKIFGGIKIKNKINSKLGVEWGVDFVNLNMRTDRIKQTYSEYDYKSGTKYIKEEKPKFSNPLQTLILNFMIYHNIDKELSKRIYFRTAYNYRPHSRTDNFFVFQFGYSTDMKGLLKIFSKDSN